MFSLIFFTTNKVKLAHIRYLAEEHKIMIEGFRQKTYHASYTEPRIYSREDLLRSSYESALQQAKKAKIDTSRHFFILEDTSVSIEALSTENREVPGLDVKYWMETQSFESLDNLLKEKDNNRNVIVRSDILLHIPDQIKDRLRLSDDYLVFTGCQNGTVATKEYSFDTNLIFPWQDNKSFNKWFVPFPASLPFSLLSIDQAIKFDFRNHAFSKLYSFLNSRGLLNNQQKQISMALDVTPMLIVCGFTCAGKTTISQHLIKKHGYMHIEASDFMYLNYYLRHDVNSKIHIADFAEKALEIQPHIAAQKIAEHIEKHPNRLTVISGFRSEKEIDWLVNYFEYSKKFVIAFVQASQEIRFKRYINRMRDRVLSLDEFMVRDEQQVRMGLDRIEKSHDLLFVKNENGLDEFYASFENELLQSTSTSQNAEVDFLKLNNITDNIKLEDAILLALLSKWENEENRQFFTTSTIARLIREVFPQLKTPKHKDNVSRYFNQDFYPYYEIEPDSDENKRKYRLSNTGCGKAHQLFYEISSKL